MVGHESGMTPQRVLEEASPNDLWEMAFLPFSYQTVPQCKKKLNFSIEQEGQEFCMGQITTKKLNQDIYITA